MSDYFKTKASGVFPNAIWTGGSSIHASIAKSGVVPLDWNNPRLIMSSLEKADFGSYIQRCIIKACPGMEWLMNPKEFQDLLHVDFYRLLKGQKTVETNKRLTNPSTGNKFHRVSLVEEHKIVGGVRVWINQASKGSVIIGWRFRLEEQLSADASGKVRAKARQIVKEIETTTVELKAWVAQEQSEMELELETYL